MKLLGLAEIKKHKATIIVFIEVSINKTRISEAVGQDEEISTRSHDSIKVNQRKEKSNNVIMPEQA